MTSLLSARRRAEEFAAAVDAPPGSPAPPALTELLDLVGTLRAQDPTTPRPEFTASLRERLMIEAEQILVQDAALTLPRRRTGSRERRLAIAASAFVLVGGSAGLAAAAQHALPGDALYPIKRGIESAHSGLSPNRVDKGRDLLHQADSRLTEVSGLLAEDPGSVDRTQVPATIRDFAAQAQEGSDLLLDAYGENQDPGVVLEVRTFAADGLSTLVDLAKDAPADQQDDLAAAAAVLQQIDRDASGACSSCASDLPALQLPSTLLASAEVDRALDALQPGHAKKRQHSPGTAPGVGPRHKGGGKTGNGSTKGGSTNGGDGSTKGGTKTGDGSTDGDGSGAGPGPSSDGQPQLPGLPAGGTGGGVPPKAVPDVPGVPKLPGELSKSLDKPKDVLPDPLDDVLKNVL